MAGALILLGSGCSNDVPERSEVLELVTESMTDVRDGLVAAGVPPARADDTVTRFGGCVYTRLEADDDELRALAAADSDERLDVIQRNTEDCQQIIIDSLGAGV